MDPRFESIRSQSAKKNSEGKCEFKFKRAERNVQTETQSKANQTDAHRRADARHSQVPMSPLVL